MPSPELINYGQYGIAMKPNDGQWQMRYYDPDELPEISLQSSMAAQNRSYPAEKINWRDEIVPAISPDDGLYYEQCYDYFALNGKPLVPATETLEVMRILELCKKNSEQ